VVTATAECKSAAANASTGIVAVRIANDSRVPVRLIAVAGIDMPQPFQPLLAPTPSH